jgi:hypothetical protein
MNPCPCSQGHLRAKLRNRLLGRGRLDREIHYNNQFRNP